MPSALRRVAPSSTLAIAAVLTALATLAACASVRQPVTRPGISLMLPSSGDLAVAVVKDALGPAGNQLVDSKWYGDTLVLSVVYARPRGSGDAIPEVAVSAILIRAARAEATHVRVEGWVAPLVEVAQLNTLQRRTLASGRPMPVRRGDPEWKRVELVARLLEEAGAKRLVLAGAPATP